MSSEGLAWAFKQDVKPSGAKFTLVALCECANYKTGRIMPSIAYLAEITGQDRKSIIAHIAQLEQQGFIADTGERVGQTKQIKVYEAHLGTVPKAEPFQKRNSSENDVEQSQKRDTEPSWEPSPLDSANALSAPILKLVEPPAIELKPEHVVEAWNDMAGRTGLPRVRKLDGDRMRKLRARIRENTIEDFTEAIGAIERSPFLRGEKDWRGAGFDFLLSPSKFNKLLEGQYEQPATQRR